MAPGMNDGLLIEEIDPRHYAILKILFGFNADMPQDGPNKFGEEALDQIKP